MTKPSQKSGDLEVDLDQNPIEAKVAKVLEGKVQRKEIGKVTEQIAQIAVSENFSGPIPQPRHFAGYESVQPGSADRILTMAEKGQDHTMAMQREALRNEERDQRLGVLVGAGLLLFLMAFGTLAVYLTGDWKAATPFLGAATLAGVGALLKRT